jgi:3-hydroxyisobutyrate dehydrogenase
MSSPRIAFLGLGIMGGGMARRLAAAGFPLTVYNRNPARAEPLANTGVHVAQTAREAVDGADIIVSMVADDAASRSVWTGDNGALAGVRPGCLLVECSTLTVSWVQTLVGLAAERGCELVDAPVTGSKQAAAAGELNFLVGASADAFSRVRPVLEPMSRSVNHLGPTGSGASVKLMNNFLCGVQVTAFAEALAWLERDGIDPAKALALLTDGAAGSPIVKLMAMRMTTPDYSPNFFLRLMAKDLGYAIEAAAGHGVPLQTGSAALGSFQRAIAGGYGDHDMAAVVEPLRRPLIP